MTRRAWIGLTLAGLIPLLAAWFWVTAPGYTDAEYYMATARQLATGRGLTEPFVWNYLAGVMRIPHPSHLYWMPLTTFLAAAPMAVFGEAFRIAQAPFLLLALSIPPLSAWVALRLGGTPRQAMLAGILAALPGFYLPFLVTTDSFGLYALIGTMIFLALVALIQSGRMGWALAAGVGIGLAHLTRADGLVFLLPAGWALVRIRDRRAKHAAMMLAGYLTIAGPWMIRMALVTGSAFPPGASRALWLPDYDSLFSYPASALTPAAMFAAGWGAWIGDRIGALLTNSGAFFLVNGLVYLGPFMLAAGWRRRQRPWIQLAFVYLVGLLLLMSLAFPFPGTRGGFFHSSSALMPTLWALAALGLGDGIRALAKWRGWEPARAQGMFAAGAILISLAATGFLVWIRLAGPELRGAGWGRTQESFSQLGDHLSSLDDDGVQRVAVNDPPGYWLATGQQAVVIPNGDPHVLIAVVQDFDVEWVALDANRPAGLADLYADPKSIDGLEFVESLSLPKIGTIRVFRAGDGS